MPALGRNATRRNSQKLASGGDWFAKPCTREVSRCYKWPNKSRLGSARTWAYRTRWLSPTASIGLWVVARRSHSFFFATFIRVEVWASRAVNVLSCKRLRGWLLGWRRGVYVNKRTGHFASKEPPARLRRGPRAVTLRGAERSWEARTAHGLRIRNAESGTGKEGRRRITRLFSLPASHLSLLNGRGTVLGSHGKCTPESRYLFRRTLSERVAFFKHEVCGFLRKRRWLAERSGRHRSGRLPSSDDPCGLSAKFVR